MFTPEVIGHQQYQTAIRNVLRVCQERGFTVGGSRLQFYEKTLSAEGGARRRGDLSISACEVPQIALIFERLIEDPTFSLDIPVLIGGKAHTLFAGDHDPARDMQWELFLAATLKSRGLSPRRAEPDIVVGLTIGEAGIAAKRPRRDGKFLERIKEGADQLNRYKTPGIVALDATLFPTDPGKLIATLVKDLAQADLVAGSLLRDVTARNGIGFEAVMKDLAVNQFAHGVLVHLVCPISLERSGLIAVGQAWGYAPVRKGITPLEWELLRALGLSMSSAIKSPEESGPGPVTLQADMPPKI